MVNYAQLNSDNICVAVSKLKDYVDEYNYEDVEDFNPVTGETLTENVFISRMIEIPKHSLNYLGLRYKEGGTWEEVK